MSLMSTTIALNQAWRPSAEKSTPGSLATWKGPPVQAESPGTRIRENVRPPLRDAITRSVARPSWIQATRILLGSRGFTATELSCAYPGENPGLSFAHGAPGENGLAGEIRWVSTRTFAAAAVHDRAATSATSARHAGASPPKTDRSGATRPRFPGAKFARSGVIQGR